MAAATCAAPPAAAGFDVRVRALRERHVALWARTPVAPPEAGPPVGRWRQWANARAARRLLDDVVRELGRLPEAEAQRLAWAEALRERVERFGEERLGWPDGYRRLPFADAFLDTTLAFVREARRVAPGLSVDQLGQALRNVWIGHTLQLFLGRPVRLGPGLFAYSLLYPLTDNWLDDAGTDAGEKRAFQERFGRRLAGWSVKPTGAREATIFGLVERIEREFPRAAFPSVYESLLAIHAAQSRSLAQDDPRAPDEAAVLEISFEKGGTSVLADLYLVAGEANEHEQAFAFGYGVFLQLLDDLQDVDEDAAAGHETHFTRARRRGALDAEASRLLRFIDRVLDDARGLAPAPDLPDLVRRNSRGLLVATVAARPSLVSRGLRRRLQAECPLRFAAFRRLKRRALRSWHGVAGPLLGRVASGELSLQAPGLPLRPSTAAGRAAGDDR